AGLATIAAGLVFLGHAPVAGDYLADVLPGLVLRGVGAGLSFASLTTAAPPRPSAPPSCAAAPRDWPSLPGRRARAAATCSALARRLWQPRSAGFSSPSSLRPRSRSPHRSSRSSLSRAARPKRSWVRGPQPRRRGRRTPRAADRERRAAARSPARARRTSRSRPGAYWWAWAAARRGGGA